MLPIKPEYLAALASTSTMRLVGRVRSGGRTHDLDLVDWSVRADETQVSRYQCTLTLSSSTNPEIIRPYGSILTLKHRLEPAGLDPIEIPAGVYRLHARSRALPGRQPVVQGASFEMLLDRWKFTAPRTVMSSSTTWSIFELIRECVPAADVHIMDGLTDKRVPRITYPQERWGAIRSDPNSLARSIGAAVFHHATGQWRIQPAPLLSDVPVWSCLQGAGGALVSADDSVDDSRVVNAWVMVGQRSGGPQIARAFVVDDDPYSPTYANGVSKATGDTFGRFVGFITSPLLEDNGQALRAGLHRLATSTGLSETLSLNSVPNPALEVGDVITTTAGQAGWKRIVSSIEWTPGQMSIGTRVVRAELY